MQVAENWTETRRLPLSVNEMEQFSFRIEQERVLRCIIVP